MGLFFVNKIHLIRDDIKKCSRQTYNTSESSGAGNVLESFMSVTISEIIKLILKSPTKSSILDPIPAWLLKDCVNELLCPLILNIISSSIESSVVPGSSKRAQICLLLKKNDLD